MSLLKIVNNRDIYRVRIEIKAAFTDYSGETTVLFQLPLYSRRFKYAYLLDRVAIICRYGSVEIPVLIDSTQLVTQHDSSLALKTRIGFPSGRCFAKATNTHCHIHFDNHLYKLGAVNDFNKL
jgi:hypothetical protein